MIRPVPTVPRMDWPPPTVHNKGESLPLDLHGLTLVVVAGACLTGMFLASLVQLPPVSLLIGGVPALVGIPLLWKDTRGRIILLIVLSLFVGAWRYSMISPANRFAGDFPFHRQKQSGSTGQRYRRTNHPGKNPCFVGRSYNYQSQRWYFLAAS